MISAERKKTGKIHTARNRAGSMGSFSKITVKQAKNEAIRTRVRAFRRGFFTKIA